MAVLKVTQTLIASLILIGIIASMFVYYMTRTWMVSTTQVLPEVQSILDVYCTTGFIDTGNFYMTPLTYLDIRLWYGVKNHVDRYVTVESVVPLGGENVTFGKVYLGTRVSPYGYAENYLPVNWGPTPYPAIRVAPGDVINIEYGTIKKEVVGTVAEYFSPPATEMVLSNYVSPFAGNKPYQLSLSQYTMYSTIANPGYAVRKLLQDKYGWLQMLALAEVQPKEYYYADYDIPFYLHFYVTPGQETGFYIRANGQLGLIGVPPGQAKKATVSVPTNQPTYVGLWVAGGQASLYINDNTAPSLTWGAPDISNAYSVYGVAREKKLDTIIKLYAYSSPGSVASYTEIDFENMNFKYYNGQGKLLVSGNIPVFQPNTNNYINSILRNYGVAFIPNPTPTRDTTLVVKEQTRGQVTLILPAVQGAVFDGVLVWEDLVGYYGPGSSYIDGNGDEWIRITQLADGSWRVAVLYAAGGFRHEMYLGNYLVFVKDYGQSFVCQPGSSTMCEVTQVIRWVENRVSSDAYYMGVFKSRYLTIKGLFPGDRIVLMTPLKTYVTIADETIEQIDLLSVFTVKQLIEAMKGGGIILIIEPSTERIFMLLPTRGLFHVVSDFFNTWIEVPLKIRPYCNLTVGFRSNGLAVIERAGEVYKLYIQLPNTATLSLFGTYPKLYVEDLYRYTVEITYTDGSTVTIRPNTPVTVGGAIRMFTDGIKIILVSDRVVIIDKYTVFEDAKPFQKIKVTGSFEVVMFFAK